MKCPNCSKNLSILNAGDIQVEACSSSCGGVWFDAAEIDKFDEPHEFASHEILTIAKRCESVKVDGERLKTCPKCPNETLVRQFIDHRNEVEMDQCWSCGGIWLDVGEVNRIRDQYATIEERSAAANSYISQAVDTARKELELNTKIQMARYNESTRNRFQGAIRAFEELIGVRSKLPD